MKLFLGVDGGQSNTTALLGDDTGRVLGLGRGGPCNHVGAAEGRAKLTLAVQDSAAAACAEAGLDPAQVRLEVLDRGPGLPAGVADAEGNLLAGATSDVGGLGLEIARSLSAANGGSIGITPRPGGGTAARIDFPAAPLPDEA